MKINWEKLNYRVEGGAVGGVIGVLAFAIVISNITPEESKPLVCPDVAVSIGEYKTVVKSLDLCNERLHQVVVDAYENDYEIQRNYVVERFAPDDTAEARELRICSECSATCEEALQWCYFYRGESCFCLDEEEEW